MVVVTAGIPLRRRLRAPLRRGAFVPVLLLATLLGASASAQTPPAGACETLLDEAQARYVDLDFAPVEALVLSCVLRPETALEDRRRGYRLLTLSFLRQELMRDARGAALRLLDADPAYAPDPVQDPPDYVALVQTLRDQLSVTALPMTDGTSRVPPPTPHLNVNRALAEDLAQLPGVDGDLATRIVAYRTANGPFSRVSELDRVDGIAETLLERLVPYLTTDEPQPATGGRAAR